jgi:cation transporter-like permease
MLLEAAGAADEGVGGNAVAGAALSTGLDCALLLPCSDRDRYANQLGAIYAVAPTAVPAASGLASASAATSANGGAAVDPACVRSLIARRLLVGGAKPFPTRVSSYKQFCGD